MKKLLFALLFGFVATTASAGTIDYLSTNTDPSTVQISDELIGNNVQSTRLYALFNDFFQLTGDAAYTSSNELYADRGLKGNIQHFTASEGAKMVSSFKSAGFASSLNFVDQSGNLLLNDDGTPVYSNYAAAGEDQRFKEDLVDFPVVGEYSLQLDVWNPYEANGTHDLLYSNYALNPDGMINMLAIDVTDLIQAMYPDMVIDTAYLFTFEDRPSGGSYLDYDYQDYAFIAINVKPTLTPEPATAALFGLALLGLPFARKLRRRNEIK